MGSQIALRLSIMTLECNEAVGREGVNETDLLGDFHGARSADLQSSMSVIKAVDDEPTTCLSVGTDTGGQNGTAPHKLPFVNLKLAEIDEGWKICRTGYSSIIV